jgi:hypothetical protein
MGFVFCHPFFHMSNRYPHGIPYGMLSRDNYETGKFPENRFWEVGDDPTLVIKIDKPHLCSETGGYPVFPLLYNSRFHAKPI